MALLVQRTMASTILGPKALTAVGALPHSYPYLPTDPCQGTGLWRQLLLRVGRVKLGKGEGGQEFILWSGKEDWCEQRLQAPVPAPLSH